MVTSLGRQEIKCLPEYFLVVKTCNSLHSWSSRNWLLFLQTEKKKIMQCVALSLALKNLGRKGQLFGWNEFLLICTAHAVLLAWIVKWTNLKETNFYTARFGTIESSIKIQWNNTYPFQHIQTGEIHTSVFVFFNYYFFCISDKRVKQCKVTNHSASPIHILSSARYPVT